MEASESLAEYHLAEWCEVAGVDPDRAFGNCGDFTLKAADGQISLAFERSGVPATKTKLAAVPDAAVDLKHLRSDDDCPYHRFFPAAWPVAPGATVRFRWYIVSTGAGFNGLSLRLGVDGPTTPTVEGVGLLAYRFYNGQVTSMTPVASFAGTVPSEPFIEIADFCVPAVAPQTRNQFLLQLEIDVRLTELGEATLTPALVLSEAEALSPNLPPLRLSAIRPHWMPIVSRSERPDAGRLQAVLRLNTPSVLSTVAILPDIGDATRDRAKGADGDLAREPQT